MNEVADPMSAWLFLPRGYAQSSRAWPLLVFPGVGHDAWNPAYADPALVPWLMARKRA